MKFVIICVLICASVTASAAIDRTAFSFTHYDLDVRIEPAQQRLAVRGKVSLRNDSNAPQKNVFLQISSSLDWLSITADGKPLQFVSQPYTSDIDHTGALSEAIVSLPQALAPGQSIDLQVGYEGVVSLDATRLTRIGAPEADAKHSDWDQIASPFTAVRGAGYVSWYPLATEAASLSDQDSVFETLANWNSRESSATMEANLCVEAEAGHPITVLANGDAVSSPTGAQAASSCHRFHFSHMKSVSPSFAAGPYRHLQHQLA